MIADRVLPLTPPLGKSEFKWFRYKIDDSFIVPDTRLGRKSKPAEVEFEVRKSPIRPITTGCATAFRRRMLTRPERRARVPRSGPIRGYGHHPHDPSSQARPGSARGESCVRGGSLRDDYKETLAAGDRFDAATSSPLKTLEEALTKPIFRPNIAVFGQAGWSAFRQHKDVLAATNKQSGAEAGLASRRAVAELLEVDEVLWAAAAWPRTNRVRISP